jgi:hypothetical protein
MALNIANTDLDPAEQVISSDHFYASLSLRTPKPFRITNSSVYTDLCTDRARMSRSRPISMPLLGAPPKGFPLGSFDGPPK